jgi:ubiquinone/menaquinone biosynthesis C-methylase UbiE
MTHDPLQADLTPAAFRERVSMFQQSRVLLTAFELGLFTALGEGALTPVEASRVLQADLRATSRLMNALVAMGYLDKQGTRYANGAFAARHLAAGRPGYMAGLMHSVHLWKTWSTLTGAVRAGRSVATRESGEAGERWREAFIAAMHWRGVQQAPVEIALLDLGRVRRMLDVGGGSGAYAMACVRAHPGLEAVVFDLPEILPITRRYVEEAGLAGHVRLVAGDLTTDDLGRDFDFVLISSIVHSFPPEENRRLVAKAARALTPGGQVVVRDFLMDEDRSGPLLSALFALNMLVGTEAGDTYTESEIRGWMEAAGLGGVGRIDTASGASLVVGRLSP